MAQPLPAEDYPAPVADPAREAILSVRELRTSVVSGADGFDIVRGLSLDLLNKDSRLVKYLAEPPETQEEETPE